MLKQIKGDKFITYVMYQIMKVGKNYDEFKTITEKYALDKNF